MYGATQKLDGQDEGVCDTRRTLQTLNGCLPTLPYDICQVACQFASVGQNTGENKSLINSRLECCDVFDKALLSMLADNLIFLPCSVKALLSRAMV